MHKVLEIHHKQVSKWPHLGDGEEQNRGAKEKVKEKSVPSKKTQSTVEPYWAAGLLGSCQQPDPQILFPSSFSIQKKPKLMFCASGGTA